MSMNVSSTLSYADDSCAHTRRKKVKTGCQTCKYVVTMVSTTTFADGQNQTSEGQV